MAEVLLNDFSTTLAATLAADATTCTVTAGVPASAVGSSGRVRIGTEILLATFTTATGWALTREAEDADRYPRRAWPAGTAVDAVLTAAGVAGIVAASPASLPSGGATGAILQKSGPADYAAQWFNLFGSNNTWTASQTYNIGGIQLTGGAGITVLGGAITLNGSSPLTAGGGFSVVNGATLDYLNSPLTIRPAGGTGTTDTLLETDGTTTTIRNKAGGGWAIRNAADTANVLAINDAGTAIGLDSLVFSFGSNNTVGSIGSPSCVIGSLNTTTSTGISQFVLGQGNAVSGTANILTAVGQNNTVSGGGQNLTAVGQGNTVSGSRAHAVGDSHNLSGTTVAALGSQSTVSGTGSVALGFFANVSRNGVCTFASYPNAPAYVLQQVSSTLTPRDIGDLQGEWADSTDATRTGRIRIVAYSVTTAQTGLTVEANAAGVRIGFNGATAIAKPTITGSRGGNAALASLLTALASYGLITDSTTA